MRRESYSNRFANALTGIDLDNPGTALDRSGHPNPVPRVVGDDRAQAPGAGARPRVPARRNTDRMTKMTVPGPFTMSQQAQNEHYEHDAELALAYAAAVNDEIADLFAAGADIVQIDEPYMQARPEKAREYGRDALAAALDGHRRHDRRAHLLRLRGDHPRAARGLLVPAPSWPTSAATRSRSRPRSPSLDDSVLDGLPGKTIILGVLDLDDHAVETPETVAGRIRRALPYKGADELVAAPDCGMKYLPRASAFGKLQSLVAGARLVREAG